MCGIFGIVYANGKDVPSDEKLRRSAKIISHRGPDGFGIYQSAGIGLTHTRLSLVDLDKRSNQPLWNSDRRYCIVYNGEIYNFRDLREELIQRGIRFSTTSDTEVLLQCLAIDGPQRTLPRLEGMFAFAFYDTQERTLVLARDRFGIKPLLIYQDSNQILFASEAKAMRPWLKLRPNGFRIVSDLMEFSEPARKGSLFENVEIVPPGSVVEISIGSLPQIDTYIEPPDMMDRAKSEQLEALTDEQVVDYVDEALQRSVRQMLFADARVGALCSGGVDSSLIMAMAARKHTNLAIFHANVVGPHSEHHAALQLAKHLKLDLLTTDNTDDDYIELTPEVLYHYEKPFLRHQHSVPFMMVSQLVSDNGVKAVLSGEGSDECFLGYKHLAREPIWNLWRHQTRRLERLIQGIPKIGKVLWPTQGRTGILIGDMLSRFERTLEERRFRELYAERFRRPPDRNVRTLDLMSYHLLTLLHRNDTMGMAAGIEARFPFLDEKLVETAINLPYRHKIRFSPFVWVKNHPLVRDKWVIRRVADRYLPKNLSQRPKWGFTVTAFDRMRIRKEFFKGAFVCDLFKLNSSEFDYLFETADQALKVKLMMLEAWGQIFIEDVGLPAVRAGMRQNAYFQDRS
jgi:asparagine synthase (glutamine-hydrolysing)